MRSGLSSGDLSLTRSSAFADLPPLNLLALGIMWPLSHFLTPRWFHKVNVFATRTLSLPILLFIALYERQSAAGSFATEWFTKTKVALTAKLPRRWADKLSLLEGAHWECEAVFEYTPSGDEKSSTDDDDFDDDDDDESVLGPDEVDEALRRVPQSMKSTNRASAVIDGGRMPAPLQRVLSGATDGVAGSGSASPAFKSGYGHLGVPSSPMPLSRQPSYAAASEASTIRAASRSRSVTPGQHTRSKLVSPTSPVETNETVEPVSISEAAQAALAAPVQASPPRTHFAPPPRPKQGGGEVKRTRTMDDKSAGSRPRSSGLELKRAKTLEERLPANARGLPRRRRRGSLAGGAMSEASDSSFTGVDFLPTSLPRDSPLARLYHVQAGEADALQRVGALRRRMSVGPNTEAARHARQNSDGAAIGLRRSQGANSTPEPSTAQLVSLVESLVATVNRLENKIDADRLLRQHEREAAGSDSSSGGDSRRFSDDDDETEPIADA